MPTDSEKVPCVDCAAGLHNFCVQPEDISDGFSTCCCYSLQMGQTEQGTPNGGIRYALQSGLEQRENSEGKNKTYRDILSTGRKRAAKAKPIPPEGAICEWAGLKYAGGGVKPIIGCGGTLVLPERGKYARHHGPDKSTFNNGPENLHLICPRCHNRWHSLNDPFYGKRPPDGQPFIPVSGDVYLQHDSQTKATASERLENEVWWQENPVTRTMVEEDEYV